MPLNSDTENKSSQGRQNVNKFVLGEAQIAWVPTRILLLQRASTMVAGAQSRYFSLPKISCTILRFTTAAISQPLSLIPPWREIMRVAISFAATGSARILPILFQIDYSY